jgi:isochorismate synthase
VQVFQYFKRNDVLNPTFGISINIKAKVAVKKEEKGLDTYLLQSVFHHCSKNNLPFAAYRIPGQDAIHIIHQNQSALSPLESINDIKDLSGFLLHPFTVNSNYQAYLIKPDVVLSIPQNQILINYNERFDSSRLRHRDEKVFSKDDFEEYINSAKREMGNGSFEKIVAARCLKQEPTKDFDPIIVFINACTTYPHTFVSLVSTIETGMWIGASPEILLKFADSTFTTYSLAGTKATDARKDLEHWGKKEQQEQKIVSQFIEKELKSFPEIALSINGPETIEAGNIMHLRTTFNINNLSKDHWPELVAKLHPTPAVCGMPKQAALEFILGHENHTRAYYSGFLGPVNINEQINLYVNLRCMEVQQDQLLVHVGCGITPESEAQAEWDETILKSKTMLKLLDNSTL